MKATVERTDLHRALSATRPAIGRTGWGPTAGMVRITTDAKTVRVEASDGDLTITTSLIGGTSDGVAVASHALLARFVGTLPTGSVGLVADNDGLHVTHDAGNLTLRTADADTWPHIADPDGAEHTIDAATWADIARVATAASTDDARPALTGVRFEAGHIVATDSYRLHILDVDHDLDALVPAGALDAARKALHANGAILVTTTERSATFADDTTIVRTSLLAADYPNWKQLLPESTPHHHTVDRQALLAGLERVSLFAEGAVPTRLDFNGDTVAIAAASQGVGEAATTIATDGGGDVTVAFNPTYLSAALRALDGDTVTLGITDRLKPVVVREGNFTALVMPVRVS